jgi:hypothetical protein
MVVNFSLGADTGTPLYNALDQAMQASIQAGVTYVVSAGNDGKDAAHYSPAHVAEAITVGAFDRNNTFAWFSNHGPIVDILAPGVDVISLKNGELNDSEQQVEEMSGTSMAAAHASGAVALFLALHPMASPDQVERALRSTGRPDVAGTPSNTTNRMVYVGPDGGLLDVTLPPFLKYAIVSNDDIEFDAAVTIRAEGNAPFNASVYSGNDLKLSNAQSRIEGFGYYEGSIDQNRAAAVFQPRYNPMALASYHKGKGLEIKPFDPTNFQQLANRRTKGDLHLEGHYALGTMESPVIWYVDGKLKTSGAVTFSGYGVFLVDGDVELSYNMADADALSMLGIYTKGDIKVKSGSLLQMTGQLYAKDLEFDSAVAIKGGITAYGKVKFKNNIQASIDYRPASPAIVEPFWPQ